MESKAKLLGHPIHQMLIVFPLGLLATAVVFDLIHLFTDNQTMATVAFYMLAAGLVGGVLATPFGFIDWLAIPAGTRAKAVGLWHGGGNLVVIALFLWSWLLRLDPPHEPGGWAIALGLTGAVLAGVTGWLGGELVDRLGVGVDDGAHLDAPSSLSGKATRDSIA